MIVSSTEFKTNLGKYLDIVSGEEIIITRNGSKIARLIKEEDDKLADIRSLYGILADTEYAHMSDDELHGVIHEERRRRYDSID